MLCRNPYMSGGAAYPCGQCMPCRFNRRRMWQHRIMLEGLCHRDNCFVTLSYSNFHMRSVTPRPGADAMSAAEIRAMTWRMSDIGTLRRKDLQDWLKRLRKAILPLKLRFCGCGEYGDESGRPHYHVILFGYPTCARGRTRRHIGSDRAVAWDCCPNCDLIQRTWPFGDVDLGTLTSDSAAYVSKYVVKKMTAPDDIRLFGREPEFPARSLKPGIGHDGLWDVASALMQNGLDESLSDVPSGLRHGNKTLPFGRYMRRKLRGMIGRCEDAPQETLSAIEEEMLALRLDARSSSEEPSFKARLIRQGDGRVAQIEARNAIYGKKGKL